MALPPSPPATPASLELTVREIGTTTELLARGEWDLAQHDAARTILIAAVERHPEFVLLDLSQLSFIDASGINNVVELHHRCTREQIRLLIIPGGHAVRKLFEICRLGDSLPFLKVES